MTEGNCRKLLDSCTVSTHCGELFCQNCCTRLFTPSLQQASSPSGRPEVSLEPIASPFSAPPLLEASACDSLSDCCCCCCCCAEDNCPSAETRSDPREGRSEKRRLRGGGGEEEDADFRLTGGARRCSESDCSNLGVVSSSTSLCNAPSSPAAVTAWYNRQHSASQSTFGCQPCTTRKRSVRPSSTPTSVAGNSRNGNNSVNVCAKNNNNCISVGKASVSRRPGSPCRPLVQQQQHHQQNYQLENHQQRQQNKSLINNQGSIHHRSPAPLRSRDNRSLPLNSGVSSLGARHPAGYHHHPGARSDPIRSNKTDSNINPSREKPPSPLSKRRVSFCSDVPEEEASRLSESSYQFEMQIDESNDKDNDGYYEMEDTRTGGACSCGAAEACGALAGSNRDQEGGGYEEDEDGRLRGGCGCAAGGSGGFPTSGCAQVARIPREPDPCYHEASTPCSTAGCSPPCSGRQGCCPAPGCRPVCPRKPPRCCPPCSTEPQGCGGGGCCGGGCRGGCGKGGRPCVPLRPCSTPPCQPQAYRARGSPCAPPRGCAQAPPCCRPPQMMGATGSSSSGSCCRSRSPGGRTAGGGGCCAPQDDAGCCVAKSLPPGCECLGGGLDCQRCGRKVYQAEIQIVSGTPYHNICFSCFCCRKPLEPLTYQENCGEIYCKHCYVRNFGPQGYGYGAGAGVLQTPM